MAHGSASTPATVSLSCRLRAAADD
jgi:hypothetical protein